jgi:eukaryotic-like serine/threonine-protein kinase
MVLSSGTVIDDYEVLSLLGAGGMGEVYRARDSRLERDVAIKVLQNIASPDPENLRRFEQEARAAAALNHPNILVVHHMGRFRGVPYLVSELLEGETLRERLKKGPLPLRKVIDYSAQIARGLAAAHEKGIVHRDLKPENLFITKDDRVKILDFGLARIIQPQPAVVGSSNTVLALTEPGMTIGTPGYMSPEQVRGQATDHRTDIFVFSSIIQEMTTGKRVFEKPTAIETLTAILHEDPLPIAQLLPVNPPQLQRLVHRGMEKDPERRFQSASDLGFAIEALVDAGALATPAAQAPPAVSFRHWRAVAIASAIAVLGVAVVFAWQRIRPASTPIVSNYVQLTHDGLQKLLIGTDGSRLYLTLINPGMERIAAMPITGGEESQIPMPAPEIAPVDLASDGSAFLAVDGKDGFPPVGPFWTVPVMGGSPQRLGESVGNTAAWSPDGQTLAYADLGNLFVARADGTAPRKLLTMKGLISAIAWSPHGDYLRFGASNFSQTAVGGSAIGQQAIWQVAADGSKLHQLLVGWHDVPDECCGKWTSDGRYFVFQSQGQIWALPEQDGLFHSPLRPLQLTSSPMPLTSPLPGKDGKKLFVVGRTYRGELTRFEPKSGRAEPFLNGTSVEWLDFSKDGKWVTYVSYPEGTLWKSKVDGSDATQLTFPPLQPVLPRWSPDGKSILFFEFPVRSGRPGVAFQISADGGIPQRILPDDQQNQQDSNWSPDGTKIVFAGGANDAGIGDAAAGIRVLNLANHQISLIPGSQKLFSPRWSPDGRYLLAMTSNSSTILLYDFQTQKWTELARGTFGWPSWSTDGKSIYVMDYAGSGSIDSIRVIDHTTARVLDLGGFTLTGQGGGSVSFSPDGSPLLLRDRGTQDVYALDWHE